MKMKLIDELNDYLGELSFRDVKEMCEAAKAKTAGAESPEVEGEELDEMGKPVAGIAIKKVEVMKPEAEDELEGAQKSAMGEESEMSDEELKELMSKFMK